MSPHPREAAPRFPRARRVVHGPPRERLPQHPRTPRRNPRRCRPPAARHRQSTSRTEASDLAVIDPPTRLARARTVVDGRIEPGLLLREDGVAELQRVPVGDDRGHPVEARRPGSAAPPGSGPRSSPRWWKLSARARRRAASLRRSRLGRMVPVRLILLGGEQARPCNPSSSTGRATLPEPHPPDADQGGPDRARERRGPRCIRSVRRGPRAGLPARRFGGVPPRPPLLHAVPGREVGLHAQSSHPPPERVKSPAPNAGSAGGADAAPGRTWKGGPASIPRP